MKNQQRINEEFLKEFSLIFNGEINPNFIKNKIVKEGSNKVENNSIKKEPQETKTKIIVPTSTTTTESTPNVDTSNNMDNQNEIESIINDIKKEYPIETSDTIDEPNEVVDDIVQESDVVEIVNDTDKTKDEILEDNNTEKEESKESSPSVADDNQSEADEVKNELLNLIGEDDYEDDDTLERLLADEEEDPA